jgi:hypothetical protein
VAEGGGIIIKKFAFYLDGDAKTNAGLIEEIVLLYRSHQQVLHIDYDKFCFPQISRSGDYPYLIAAIADFYGVRHDFDRDKYHVQYQPIAQRVYAALRLKHPKYTPPENLWRHPGMWLHDCIRGMFQMLAIVFWIGLFTGGLWGIFIAIVLWLLAFPVIYAVHWFECHIVKPPHSRRF